MLIRKIRFTLIIAAGGLLSLLSFTRFSHAQTIVSDGYLSTDTVWDRAHSPYIIEDQVYIPNDKSLTIAPGTTVIASSSLSGLSLIYVQGGRLQVGDNRGEPVRFSGDSGITINHSHSIIANSLVELSRGLSVYDSEISLSSTTIVRTNLALRTRTSHIDIVDSNISENKKGIYIEDPNPAPIFPAYLSSKYYFGGEGNISLDSDVIASTTLKISNSSLVSNRDFSIKNEDPNFVIAKNNWWGDVDGPSLLSSNKIIGNVYYEPWIKDPHSICCSNIVFIPGLEASRLYSDKGIIGKNTLWEPNRNADVSKLFLDNTGKSKNDILVGNILEKAYGVADIYGTFSKYLDSLKQSEIINNWLAYSYDWRKSIDKVIDQKENRLDSSLDDLVTSIMKTASTSKTGKVTLIAHSNGGLIMKYVYKILKDRGLENIIDKAIGVAVPYLGTPSAISGLLHGDGQRIAGGLFLSQSIARNLGVNMPSAYSLLPSMSYFAKAFGPTIAFASTTVQGLNDAKYEKEINNSNSQNNFILDTANNRKVDNKNTNLPIKGNSGLLHAAEIIHNLLDPFPWNKVINYWAIIGWNKLTTQGIKYDNKDCKDCSGITHTNKSTKLGDGTVVANSAEHDSGNSAYIDLANAGKKEGRDIDHSNIMGATSTINSIDRIIKNDEDNEKIKEQLNKIDGVQVTTYSKLPVDNSYIIVSTHSPVDLHVYDRDGKHVGINNLAQELGIEPGLVTSADQGIIGSTIEFQEQNDGSTETYIYLPYEIGEKYNIRIDGNNFGQFSYKVEKIVNDEKVDSIIYENIPVMPTSVASTSLYIKTGSSLKDQVADINLDFDGDGLVDDKISTISQFDDYQLILKLRKMLDKYCLSSNNCKSLKNRLDKIQAKMLNSKNTNKKIDLVIFEAIGHIEKDHFDQKNRDKVMQNLSQYIKQLE